MGHGISGSVSSLDSVTATSNAANTSDMKAEKWKQGARKTLLNWVTNALPKYVTNKTLMGLTPNAIPYFIFFF